jgi:hypothetical protein
MKSIILYQKEIRMKIRGRSGQMIIVIAGVLGATAGVRLLAQENGSVQKAREGIERLHQQDVEATLSGKADDFAKLWDSEAVRIGPGGPVEIGKAVVYADDKREENSGGGQSLCYRSEIKDLRIAGGIGHLNGVISRTRNLRMLSRGEVRC